MKRTLLLLIFLLLWPAAACPRDRGRPGGRGVAEGRDRVRRRHDAARRHPAPQGPARATPRRRSSSRSARTSTTRARPGPIGPARGHRLRPGRARRGPSDRFYDFIEGAKLIERGYTFVMVDLRGFGGSGGCLDWGGPGEQMDVKAAVEWAASQPWSTGAVGMYGKSYDGVTGLVGAVSEPQGPEGRRLDGAGLRPLPLPVLQRRPLRELGGDARALRRDRRHAGAAAATTRSTTSTARRRRTAWRSNYASQQDSNHDSEYWKARNLIAKRATDGKVPLFLTQGFLENNTKPDGAFDFFNAVNGAQARLVRHVGPRPRQRDATPTTDLVERAARASSTRPCASSTTTSATCRWPTRRRTRTRRSRCRRPTARGARRQQWPPADSTPVTVDAEARRATTATARTRAPGSAAGNGLWTISPPLSNRRLVRRRPAREARPQRQRRLAVAGVVVDTYDIDAERKAILLSRNASLVGCRRQGRDGPLRQRLEDPGRATGSACWSPTPTRSGGCRAAPVAGRRSSPGTVTLPFLKYTAPATRSRATVRAPRATGSATRRSRSPEDVISASTEADFPLPARR